MTPVHAGRCCCSGRHARGSQATKELRQVKAATDVQPQELSVMRNSQELTFEAELLEAEPAELRDPDVMPRLEGARLRELEPTDPHHGVVDGVMVESVESGNAAARNGLRVADLIFAVNRRPVGSLAELRTALEAAGTTAALSVLRNGTRLFLVIG